MSENTNYKFGENQASVYDGKEVTKSKTSFLKKLGILNSICIFFTVFLIANIINSVAVEMNITKQTKSLEAERYNWVLLHARVHRQLSAALRVPIVVLKQDYR